MRHSILILMLACMLAVLGFGTAGMAHPANIAGAQANVQPDGSFQIRARFDLLAFALDDTPQQIGDVPMNALLDGPNAALVSQLADAKQNFQQQFSISCGSSAATIDSIDFPTAADVHKWAVEGGATRLPVMLPVVINGHLPANAPTFSVRFPEILGTVVLTTELPYQEPVSEPLDDGAYSTPLKIPTAQQIASAQVAMNAPRNPLPNPSPEERGSRFRSSQAPPVSDPHATHFAGARLPKGGRVLAVARTAVLGDRPMESPPRVLPTHQWVYNGEVHSPRPQPLAAPHIAKTNKPLVKVNVPLPKSLPALSIARKTEPTAKANAPSYSKPTSGRGGEPTPVTAVYQIAQINRPPWYAVIFKYVKMGYRHILPEGLDHILFVLGLVLLSKKTKALLWQITAFTVAHSITLALSLYGIVRLPSSIVEPIIAASIAFVAIENILTTDLKPWRPFVVFAFGLVHGMGFAGALLDLGLARQDFLTALVGFNVGVELGQLSVVAMALLAIGWFRSHASYRKMIVIPGSAAIAAIAVFWTIQRTL